MKQKRRGFTTVELLTVVAIIVISMATAWVSLAPMSRRNEVLNSLRYIRGAVTSARAKAIEYTQPVRFTWDAGGTLLVERDPTRDGDWDDAIIILGDVAGTDNVGVKLPFKHVYRMTESELSASLPHWTGMTDFGNAVSFPETSIVIYPDGTVLAGDPLVPASGTFFVRDDRQSFYGAVHLTAMGEVKLAYAPAEALGTTGGGPFNGWYWTD